MTTHAIVACPTPNHKRLVVHCEDKTAAGDWVRTPHGSRFLDQGQIGNIHSLAVFDTRRIVIEEAPLGAPPEPVASSEPIA